MKPPATPQYLREVNALRVQTAMDARRQLAEQFRRRALDAAIKRALQSIAQEDFALELEHPAP